LFISQELSRRHWTVGILHGEFAKFSEPSDLAKEQGELWQVFFLGVRLRRNRAIGSLVNTHFGVQRFEGVEESDSTEWIGGILVDTEVKPLLTFRGFMSWRTEILVARFAKSQSAKSQTSERIAVVHLRENAVGLLHPFP
jgi:hypothetical protein